VEFFLNHINYFGVTHKNTDLTNREIFALNDEQISMAYELASAHNIKELYILSTCARTEFFGHCDSKDLHSFIIKVYHILERNCDYNFLIHKQGEECVKHMMEVSCSVTSLLIGETEITNQIKKSFQLAKNHKSTKSILSRLIESSLEAGKKIRNKTKLSNGSSSISYAAVEKIIENVDRIDNKKILIIGAGMTGKLVAYNLQKKGAKDVFISNRDVNRGKVLSKKINGNFLPLEKISESLSEFSIIVACTNASYKLIEYNDILKIDSVHPILFMDLSVPRNIDHKIKNIDFVTLLTIEDIDNIIQKYRQKRKSELPKAMRLIDGFVIDYLQWFDDLNVTPTIANLKNHYDRIQINELKKVSRKYDSKTLAAIDVFSNSLLKKIMKDSIEYLKSDEVNEKSKIQYIEIMSSIYKFKK
tara:strand:- start:1619 stop:2869 length:1251 start_codon:yes stop_codon:yes gene_type:complete